MTVPTVPGVSAGRAALTRNVLWNLTGTGLPIVVALWAIPVLIRNMGVDRFGLLSIIWMGVGYFSLFDFGLGRALTKLISERLATGASASVPGLVATGMRMMFGLGALSALALLLLAPWLVTSILNVPAALQVEARTSLQILALALPFVVASAGQTGILQAHQRFRAVSMVRVPLGAASFAGPALLTYATNSLVFTTVFLAVARVIAWWAFARAARRALGHALHAAAFDRAEAGALFRFGGWLAVSNVVGPLMVYGDRFVVGALLTTAAVAYYTTPYDVTTRLLILPDAATAVLFPALTAVLASNMPRARQLLATSARLLLPVVGLPAGLVVLFAPEGLQIWVGQVFANEGAPVMRLLAVGVFLNSVARLPLVLLQGHGRSDLTGKLHVLELPFYLAILVWAVLTYGVVGAAGAWVLRVLLDGTALFVLGMLTLPGMRTPLVKTLAATLVGAGVLTSLMLIDSMAGKVAVALLLCGVCGVLAAHAWRIWGRLR